MATSDPDPSESQNSQERWLRFLARPLRVVGRRILHEIHGVEQFYIRLYGIYAFVSQITFFLQCALALEYQPPVPELTDSYPQNDKYALLTFKTLLFYSVFAYFVAKTKDIISITPNRTFRSWSFIENLLRIVVEWAKGIVVVLCIREQGISFSPKTPYCILTFIYYLITEKTFVEIFVAAAHFLEMFDGSENLHVFLCLNVLAVAMSLLIELALVFKMQFLGFALVSLYFSPYIRYKDAYYNAWLPIKLEKALYEGFRNATEKELEDFDDVCAVCLNKMSKAKITPCRHYFHPACLKECLKNSFLCPICKLVFNEDHQRDEANQTQSETVIQE